MTPDYAHTPYAEQQRDIKAEALAAASARLGLRRDDIAAGGGHRRNAWKAAGLKRAPSEATWTATAALLPHDDEPVAQAGPRSRPCLHGCPGAARFFLAGWLCAAHAPPPPPPNPGPTLKQLAERRAQTASHPAAPAQPTPAPAPAPRSTTALYQAMRSADEARRRSRRGGGR